MTLVPLYKPSSPIAIAGICRTGTGTRSRKVLFGTSTACTSTTCRILPCSIPYRLSCVHMGLDHGSHVMIGRSGDFGS